jgi:chromosome segregation ATPase
MMSPRDNSGDVAPDIPGDVTPGLIEMLREQLARERDRADVAEREREAARIQAAAAEGEGRVLREELARERSRAELAEQDRETARGQAAAAEGELKARQENLIREVARVGRAEDARRSAEAELAGWTSGGPFARAIRAFLNRRG